MGCTEMSGRRRVEHNRRLNSLVAEQLLNSQSYKTDMRDGRS